MSFWETLEKELIAHNIIVKDNQVVFSTSSNSKTLNSIKEAVDYAKSTSAKNSLFLLGLWKGLQKLVEPNKSCPSNENTKRMFLSAIKFLAKQAETSPILKSLDVNKYLTAILNQDITVFSQQQMDRIIEKMVGPEMRSIDRII